MATPTFSSQFSSLWLLESTLQHALSVRKAAKYSPNAVQRCRRSSQHQTAQEATHTDPRLMVHSAALWFAKKKCKGPFNYKASTSVRTHGTSCDACLYLSIRHVFVVFVQAAKIPRPKQSGQADGLKPPKRAKSPRVQVITLPQEQLDINEQDCESTTYTFGHPPSDPTSPFRASGFELRESRQQRTFHRPKLMSDEWSAWNKRNTGRSCQTHQLVQICRRLDAPRRRQCLAATY